jgi:hypothetical protein
MTGGNAKFYDELCKWKWHVVVLQLFYEIFFLKIVKILWV